MELWECVSRQRIKYVIDCYQLDGQLDGYEQDCYQSQNPEVDLPSSTINLPQQNSSPSFSAEFFEGYEDFQEYLEELFLAYPYGQIELAVVETLVASWLQIPAIRGIPYLEKVHSKLRGWESQPRPQITPAQFQQITGLDPAPVFGEYRSEYSGDSRNGETRSKDKYAKPAIQY